MRVYYFDPRSGMYQGEDFTETLPAETATGMTPVMPPAYGKGQIPVFDAQNRCWQLVPTASVETATSPAAAHPDATEKP